MSSVKTIPMPTDQIQELFLNPNQKYEVDLRNSKLKGEAFITYIANMRMKCTLLSDPELSKSEKFEILTNFLNFNYFVDCETLVTATSLIFLRFIGAPIENTQNWISFEEVDEFIQLNLDLVDKISDFYDSLIYAIPSLNIEFKQNILEPAIAGGTIQLVEDSNIISLNAFGPLTVPHFLDCYIAFSANKPSKSKYFKYQMERFSYNKKSISDIIKELKGDCFLLGLTNIFFSDREEEKEVLNKHMQLMGV